MKSYKGFSLIEVMVSAVLLALVGMILMQTLSSSLDVKDRVEGISDKYQIIRSALSRMSRELSMAYISGHKNTTNLVVETVFKGTASSVLFTAFGNITHSANAKQSDQRVLEYKLGKDKKTGREGLLRSERLTMGKNLQTFGNTSLLCPGVKSIQFEYWSQDKNKWDSLWDTDSVVYNNELPRRVRITMVVNMDGKEDEKFMTQSEIWLTKPILVK